LAGTFTIPEGPVDYSKFFPHIWLNATFTLITFIFYGMALTGLVKFWKEMKRMIPGGDTELKLSKSIRLALWEIFAHTQFSECKSKKPRNLAHLLVFYGFILLLLVTLYAIIATFTDHYPLKLTNPFKILGNMASVMLYSGIIIMIIKRLSDVKGTGKSSYEDWLLLGSLFLLILSGTLVETARFLNWGIAYHIYFFHLVNVWFVIIYLPFTKLGHIFYRTLAMVYARSINRN
jgi:quinone-modifying oxidoreductase subunit QmoC